MVGLFGGRPSPGCSSSCWRGEFCLVPPDVETRERDLAHERSPSQMRDDLHLGLAAVTGYEVFIYTNMCLLSEP